MRDKRKSNGQFAVGHSGGPGRPRRSTEMQYLATLGEIVTIDAWEKICTRAVEDAAKGDSTARSWIAKYVLGDVQIRLGEIDAPATSREKEVEIPSWNPGKPK